MFGKSFTDNKFVSCLTANYLIKIQNTELYNLNMPHDMRCLTFKSKITSDKRFDCILNRFLIAIFGGLEQASDKLFLLVRDQWTEMSSLNHSRTSILSPLRPFCGSLFLLISHLWNLFLKNFVLMNFSLSIGYLLPKVLAQNSFEKPLKKSCIFCLAKFIPSNVLELQ